MIKNVKISYNFQIEKGFPFALFKKYNEFFKNMF